MSLKSVCRVVVALCLVAGAACSSEDGRTLPVPDPSTSTTATTVLDFSEVALAPVAPGRSPPVTRPPGPGKASIAGRVVDDKGAPVPQAFVRAAYYFDPAKPEIIEALSGPDGTYRFERLYGGRWRIRAWLAPTLATLEQPAFFLGATEQKVVDLKVKAVPDLDVTSKMAPDPPLVGWLAELAVLVVSQTVDGEGKVVRTPVGATEVTVGLVSSWSLGDAPATKATDADGTARWTMTCGDEGVHAATLVVAGREFPLTLPSCLSPASTTTVPPTTTGPSSSTSSTKPKKTTTTTRRPTSSTRPAVAPR